MNTKKFSSVYLLVTLLAGALVLAPAVTTMAAVTDVVIDNPDGEKAYTTPSGDFIAEFAVDVDSTGTGEAVFYLVGSGGSATQVDTKEFEMSAGRNNLVATVDLSGGLSEGTYDFEVVVAQPPTGTEMSDTTTESVLIDSTAPTYSSSITVQAGAVEGNAVSKIDVTFTEADSGLDPDTIEATDFEVGGNQLDGDGDRAVLSGNTVTLSYDASTSGVSALNTGETPAVNIASGESIADLAGNKLSGATSFGAPTDGIAPVVDSASAEDTDGDGYLNQITLTMSEDLTSNSPAVDRFSVTDADGTTLEVTNAAAGGTDTSGGDTVVLTLSDDKGTTGKPKLSYDSSAGLGTEVEDDASTANVLASTSPPVTDDAEPVFRDVSWNESDRTEDTFTLEFSETIAIPGTASDYSVSYGASSPAVSVDVQEVRDATSDRELTVVINDQSYQEPNENAYTVTIDNTGKVKDINGESINSTDPDQLTDSITDFVAGSPEILESETVYDWGESGNYGIDVKFSEAISTSLGSGDFSVADPYIVSSVEYDASAGDGVVTLVLDSAMEDTAATPQVTTDSDLEDQDGNVLSSGATTTPADGIAPQLDTAETATRSSIELEFTEPVENVVAGDFAVASYDVDTVTGSGTSTLTVNVADQFGTAYTPDVDYTQGDLSDSSDNKVATFSDETPDDGVGPILQSIGWTDANGNNFVDSPDTLAFNFSETLQGNVDTTNVDSALALVSGGSTYGPGATVSYNSDTITVTLATGNDVTKSAEVEPSDTVKDNSSNNNADITPEAVAVVASASNAVLMDGTYYADIASALVDAEEGDVIELLSTYDGEDNSKITVDTNVSIQAAEGAEPIVDTGAVAFDIQAEVLLEGLEIVGADDTNVIELTTTDADLEVFDSTIDVTVTDGATPEAVRGINSVGAGPVDLDNVTITGTDNDTDSYIQGVNIRGPEADGSSFYEVTMEGSDLSDADGIQARSVDNVTVEDSTFKGYDGFGLNIGAYDADDEVSGWTITGNTFDGLDRGIFVWYESDAPYGIDLKASGNDFLIDGDYGVAVYNGPESDYTTESEDVQVNAKENYWGDKTGPDGDGANVTANVTYEPWLSAPEGSLLVEGTLSYTPGAAGFHLMSVDAMPDDPTPTTVFGGSGTSLFYWDGEGYEQGDSLGDVEPELGYWFYVMESEVGNGQVSASTGMGVVSDVDTLLEGAGWHMISSPFPVSLGEIKVHWDGNEYDGLKAAPDSVISPEVFAYVDGDDADSKPDHYESVSDSAARLNPMRGYFVNTGEAEVELTLPYGPEEPPSGSAMAMSLDAQGFEPVPEGEETPPAPPAAPQAAEGLEATAAVSAEGVTFEVAGADVDSMSVQVFSANGEEVFSGSAAGNSLSWNADVANGLYIYGASVKVDGQSKPLGIQKLLILQ